MAFAFWGHFDADYVELLVFDTRDHIVQLYDLVQFLVQVVLVVDYDAVFVLVFLKLGNRHIFVDGPCREDVDLLLVFLFVFLEHLRGHVYFYVPCLFNQCLDRFLLRDPVHVVVHAVVNQSGIVSAGRDVLHKTAVGDIESVATYVEVPANVLDTIGANTVFNRPDPQNLLVLRIAVVHNPFIQLPV